MSLFLRKKQSFFSLLILNLLVKIRNFVEFCWDCRHYYCNVLFLKIDFLLFLFYLFRNPFKVSKRYLLQRGEKEVYTYGETPLKEWEKIALECRLSQEDIVFDLGCGRGRTIFWLHCFVGCKAVGIERVPFFVRKASNIKNYMHLCDVDFFEKDILDVDFSCATMIYLSGTCMETEVIEKLLERFESLSEGARVVTISYPLTAYKANSTLRLEKTVPISFNWGDTFAYFHLKGKSNIALIH